MARRLALTATMTTTLMTALPTATMARVGLTMESSSASVPGGAGVGAMDGMDAVGAMDVAMATDAPDTDMADVDTTVDRVAPTVV